MRNICVVAFLLLGLAQAQAQELGAHYDASGGITFQVYSENAERIELWLYDEAFGAGEKLRVPLTRDPNMGIWAGHVSKAELQRAGIQDAVLYGYRAWGSNWRYDPSWTPGSEEGFRADVDGEGNRFNPNKLLVDPYAREITHNPRTERHGDMTVYASGDGTRQIDSAPVAPKGVVVEPLPPLPFRPGAQRALKDQIIYEAHVRGLTMNDPSIPPEYRGTFRGAAMKAPDLARLGVTAVEFIVPREFQNQTNDSARSTADMDYWGYAELGYFSPNRRYAYDKSYGGPTREIRDMVRAYRKAGIDVYFDVVYNHTGEGNVWGDPSRAALLSWRGLDNPTYYELSADPRFYYDNNGVGPNVNAAHPATRQMIVDSLRYWAVDMGVSGFRFDLASILGNRIGRAGFEFDKMEPGNVLNRAVRELPGVHLIAEPWGATSGAYQVGGFPSGWAEWNDKFRDTVRSDLNMLGVEAVTPGDLARRFSGSPDLFEPNGRRPWHSINFVTVHDGFTLRDLFTFNTKQNDLPFPYGPSGGGSDHNRSWDHGGDPVRQRQAARTAMAMLLLSVGTPMIVAGDEMLRTQYGNNNTFNLDTVKNWIDWSEGQREAAFTEFTRRLIEFRRAHPALRPDNFFRGVDYDGSGLKDITWYTDSAREVDPGYMSSPDMHFLAYRVDGWKLGDPARSIYIAYNGWQEAVSVALPRNVDGKRWFLVADTAAWMEGGANALTRGREQRVDGARYEMAPRSALVLVESTEPELQWDAGRPVEDRAFTSAGRFVKRELAGAGQFAIAYVLKEGLKAAEKGDRQAFVEAVRAMKETAFWTSLAAFSVGARLGEHAVAGWRIPGSIKGALPLAAGMALAQVVGGHFSGRDVLLGTVAYTASGAAVNFLGDSLLYPILFRAGPPGWLAAAAYNVGKLTLSLYLGEKLEHWLRGRATVSNHAREGVQQKIEAIGK